MYSSATPMRPPSAGRFFATFGYAWFTIGLFTGTLVLVIAVRGILSVIQKFGWDQTAQNRILIGIILLFVVLSFMLARRVVRVLYRQTPRARKVGLVALAIPAAASMYAWSNPTRFLAAFAGTTAGSVQMAGGGPTFMFGSYPDEDELRLLKKQGVTTIVPLQDPRVLVELQGIEEEKKSAAREHMTLIEAPMLPWVSDNTASLAIIKDLALHGKGTYYVHCGLGRDRVNIAKRVIESVQPQSNARLAATKSLQHAAGFETRTEPFQRGRLIKLGEQSWLVPFPNADEFYGFIIQGQPGHVFLVLDPADTLQSSWIAQATKDMRQYVVKYTFVPMSAADTAPAKLARIVAQVRAQAPPVTVIVPATTFDPTPPKAPLIRALLREFGASGTTAPAATGSPKR